MDNAMENLYIETMNGSVPIPKDIVAKQHLEKGMLSPFTCSRIVGENNDFPSRQAMYKNAKNETGLLNEDPEATENVMLSTSEIIDFSQGLDSHTDE
jgi:hypothetical protein